MTVLTAGSTNTEHRHGKEFQSSEMVEWFKSLGPVTYMLNVNENCVKRN